MTGESDGLTVPKILCVLEQEDGTIFAGTDGNGIAVIKNGKVEDVYNKEDGLSSEVILRMVKNEDGGVFIVTSNGICYMDTEGKIEIHILIYIIPCIWCQRPVKPGITV